MSFVKCTTDLDITGRSTTLFSWTIKNLRDLVEEYSLDRVLSNEFNVKETKWMLEIVPLITCYSTIKDKHLKVLIHNMNDAPMKTVLRVSFEGSENEAVKYVKKIKRNSSFELCNHSFKSLADENLFSHTGALTIKCEITTFSSTIFSDGPKATKVESNPSALLVKNDRIFLESFSQFHLSKEMSDVQIKCEDQTFDAHQVILSARSPVFRAMFQAEMKEKNTRQVEIQDLKAKVIPEMLKYIYNGTCCINDTKPDIEIVSALLEAADKYQMDILKEMCETVLSGTLVIDNALQLLSLGDMHTAHDLKKNALDLIVNNAKEITGTEEWKDCAKNRPHLLIVVAEAMAASKK